MENLKESHYFHLNSQSNIYTLCPLKMSNGSWKLLVASLKRDIYCIEYKGNDSLIPKSKEVSFTYIPSSAEIISIDAFNKSTNKNEFVIGIAIIKNSNLLDSFEFYLNIYSEWEENYDFNIDNIAQNCLNVELTFTPYQLTHTTLLTWSDSKTIENKETVFLLSGSDNLIHIYREYALDHLYKEMEKDQFPEFANKLPSPVIWMDVWFSSDQRSRVVAIGCECGYVRLTNADTFTNKLVFIFSTKFNNFISHVSLYQEEKELNLVVVNSILNPVLFKDVLTFGLQKYTSLPRHDYTCVLSCCQIADFDLDGQKEILIGTSSEEVLLYKKNTTKKWCLEEIKKFPSPIISFTHIDIIEDGVRELIVLAIKGVHFLQLNFDFVERKLNEKIAKQRQLTLK